MDEHQRHHRKGHAMGGVCVVSFISIDGVIQSPLDVDEDRDGGFDRGGWVPPYSDEVVDEFMERSTVNAAALLLGRRTYDILAAAWAGADESDRAVAAMNTIPKHVVTSTQLGSTWPNSRRVDGDRRPAVAELRDATRGDVVVLGAGTLVRELARHDLVDEYRLLVFPVILGTGKRMFDHHAFPARFTVTATTHSPSGVSIQTYLREKARPR